MVDAPTDTTPQRTQPHFTYKLRRRIVGSPAKDATPPQTKYNKKTTKDVLAEESAVDQIDTSEPSTSGSSHITSLPMQMFHKSVCTPSRTESRRQSVARSIYRTPIIKSATKKVYSVKDAKKLPQAVRTKWKEDVQRILGKSWKFCYLSSVFSFGIGKSRLKAAYERTLKARILEIYPSYHLVVKFSQSSFLRQDPKRVDAIFVHVTSLVPGEDDEGDRMVTVYHGVLIRAQETLQSKACKGIEWFPLLLYSGLELLHNTFIVWLQASFDCYVTPRCLPTSTILWVAGVWCYGKCSNKMHYKADRRVSLQYQIRLPAHEAFNSLRGKGKFTIKIHCRLETVMKLWTKIKGNEKPSDPNVNDLARFHSALDDVVESLTHIPKGLLQLIQVKTPCITFGAIGKLRLTCDTTFNSLLHHLIEIFQCTFHFNNLDSCGDDIEDDCDSEVD